MREICMSGSTRGERVVPPHRIARSSTLLAFVVPYPWHRSGLMTESRTSSLFVRLLFRHNGFFQLVNVDLRRSEPGFPLPAFARTSFAGMTEEHAGRETRAARSDRPSVIA